MSEINHTMEKLAKIVGEDHVSTDRERLQPFRQAPLVSGAKPQALVRPTSTEEVKELINLAREEGMNLVLSSSAGSRFRGDSVPTGAGIVIDMSGLDQVVRMDRLRGARVPFLETSVQPFRVVGVNGLRMLSLELSPQLGIRTAQRQQEPGACVFKSPIP